MYAAFKNPHCEIFQYPKSYRIPLTNFYYGVQKHPACDLYKIWDLCEISVQFKQLFFVEFVHKINFKDQHEFFIFFTVKSSKVYSLIKVQLDISHIYTSSEVCTLYVKLLGFPKFSKRVHSKMNYSHYDLVLWKRCVNFFLGKMVNYSDLFKMAVM